MIGVAVLHVLAAASLVASNLLAAGAAGQATPQATWALAPAVPFEEGAEGKLKDVAVISPTDVWVVGWTGGGVHQTLAARWDGTGWTPAPTPDSGDPSTTFLLNAVDAVATDNVWAVGGIQDVANPSKANPLFLHYDGRAWTTSASEVDGELADIDLLTPQEGWAVGSNLNQPIILRRIASVWEPVPVPVFEGAALLESVYATSSNDAWAVGSQKRGTRWVALMLHWDGSSWSEVAHPVPPDGNSSLVAVAATSASDVWAAGSSCTGCKPLVLHLAGSTWRREPAEQIFELTSVVAFAPTTCGSSGRLPIPYGTTSSTGTAHASPRTRTRHRSSPRLTIPDPHYRSPRPRGTA
jgi:hypothetical protein